MVKRVNVDTAQDIIECLIEYAGLVKVVDPQKGLKAIKVAETLMNIECVE